MKKIIEEIIHLKIIGLSGIVRRNYTPQDHWLIRYSQAFPGSCKKKIVEEIIHLKIIGLSGIVKLFHDSV